MIKSVTITNHLGESLVLELTRPDLSGFIVKEIDGLGPVKANINTTKRATADGTAYNSAYLDQRDITFQLQFYTTGAESIEDIRHRSYKYFPLKKQVTIRVETDNRISEAIGYVESNEPNIFSSAEGCTVVVACPDPYFYSLHTSETIFSGIEPTFEFPLINDSSTESLIELGVVKNNEEENVYYAGDSEVGLKINIHALGDAKNVSIYNINTKERIAIDTSKFPTDIKYNLFHDKEVEWATGKIMYTLSGSNSVVLRDIPDDTYIVSDYIPVVPNTEVTYSLASSFYRTGETTGYAGTEIVWFDSNYLLIPKGTNSYECIDTSDNEICTATVPINARYVRVGTVVNKANSFVYQKRIEENMLDNPDVVWTTDSYINGTSGDIEVGTNTTMVSDFIPVPNITEIRYDLSYIYNVSSYSYSVIAAYDSDKEYITGSSVPYVSGTSSYRGVYKVPKGAAYVRFASSSTTDGTFAIPKKGFVVGDTVIINTALGDKSATLLRHGQTFNIFSSCIDKNTSWFTLAKGDNLFVYKAETGAEYLHFTIFNKVRYIGV